MYTFVSMLLYRCDLNLIRTEMSQAQVRSVSGPEFFSFNMRWLAPRFLLGRGQPVSKSLPGSILGWKAARLLHCLPSFSDVIGEVEVQLFRWIMASNTFKGIQKGSIMHSSFCILLFWRLSCLVNKWIIHIIQHKGDDRSLKRKNVYYEHLHWANKIHRAVHLYFTFGTLKHLESFLCHALWQGCLSRLQPQVSWRTWSLRVKGKRSDCQAWRMSFWPLMQWVPGHVITWDVKKKSFRPSWGMSFLHILACTLEMFV